MKLSITNKLFLMIALPIVTLIVYSFNHLNEKYSALLQDKQNISQLKTIQYASALAHELRIERGASASILHNVNNSYFPSLLEEQKKHTDTKMSEFLSHATNVDTLKREFSIIKNSFDALQKIRAEVLLGDIAPDRAFEFYTNVNTQLISLINNFKLSSNAKLINSNIQSLFSLIKFQEFAGQERALVAKIIISDTITNKEMRMYHNFLLIQDYEYENLTFLLPNNFYEDEFDPIMQEYESNYFQTARQEILNHKEEKSLLDQIRKVIGFGGLMQNINSYQLTNSEKTYETFLSNRKVFDKLMLEYLELSDKRDAEFVVATKLQNYFKDVTRTNHKHINSLELLELYTTLDEHHITLDPIAWFKISTQRIDQIHEIEKLLFDSILEAINKEISNNNNFLTYQITFTIVIIFLLLFGMYYISTGIRRSIKQLNNGINNFFDFLNAKVNTIQTIDTHSKDEINDMAQSINTQVHIIEKSLETDSDFIHETTQIVTLMKDGNFSERLYFEPHNPNLKELKSVFNELIQLISVKIEEQTTSLERLNASLEDRVHFQTLELEKQIQEITIAMDKAIAAELAKDEFLANMSHEIRTPLNAILGFVTILQKQIKEEKPLKYLNIIDASGKSLLVIINDILDFAKIQSGKFTITPHEASIVDEMSNVALLFASKAYEKHLIYDVYIDPNMPQTILVDTVRVKQIFSNILSNAIKFTNQDKSIKVKVIIENSRLIISVQDTGIGIAPQNLSKVFKAFEQADGSTTRKYGGTGLGLSISYKLAQLLDGELSVSSKEGIGSTFTLNIPISIKNEEPKQYIDSKKLATYTIALLDHYTDSIKLKLIKKYLLDFGAVNILSLNEYQKQGYDLLFFIPDDLYNEEIVNHTIPSIAILRNSSVRLADFEHIHALYTPFTPALIVQSIVETGLMQDTQKEITPQIQTEDEIQFYGSILVAEDNKTNQMLISLILGDFGLQYKIANNGLEAVSMFKEEKFDLVLMDENMPELNGIGAMQRIKEYEKEKKLTFTPIIALTASVLETDKEKFIKAGMDGFVGKPIDNLELIKELSRFLERTQG